MTTAPTTMQFATAKEFAANMLARFPKGHAAYYNTAAFSLRLQWVCKEVMRQAKYGIEDFGVERSYDIAAYGLSWNLETARLNRVQEQAIRNMNVRQLLMLVHRIRCACITIADTTEFLNT